MSEATLGSGSVLADFLTRLAIALPLVCAAAVLALLAMRRWGGTGLQRMRARGTPRLAVEAITPLGPTARLALVRLDGRELLVGVSASALVLLAEAGAAPGVPDDADEAGRAGEEPASAGRGPALAPGAAP